MNIFPTIETKPSPLTSKIMPSDDSYKPYLDPSLTPHHTTIAIMRNLVGTGTHLT